jgi:hypothetical protein
MKYINILIISIILISCSQNQEEDNIELNLTFSIDTIQIDSGEEILHLKDNLWISDLSEDENFLFNYNRNQNILEKIDLNQKSLERKIQFEKEGPNGIGGMISNLSLTSNNNVLVWYYGITSIFDQNANLVRDLKIEKITNDVMKQYEAYPMMLFEDNYDPDRFLGLYIKWEDTSYFLLDVNTGKSTYRIIELPELNKMNDYSIGLTHQERNVGSFGTGAKAIKVDDNIVITNTVFNNAYIFNIKSDSLYTKSWDSPLIGMSRTYVGPKQVEVETTEYWEVYKKLQEDIHFGYFIWDRKNNRFLRLSSKEKFGEEKEENGSYKPTDAEVFLSVFDKDFNLISESLVPDLKKKPGKHFTKDGKIWIFENLEDELAFIRLSVN